jgi:hypothetical protein
MGLTFLVVRGFGLEHDGGGVLRSTWEQFRKRRRGAAIGRRREARPEDSDERRRPPEGRCER